MKDPTKEQIEAAVSLAEYHINEWLEAFPPDDKPDLDQSELDDLKRRFMDTYYEGLEAR